MDVEATDELGPRKPPDTEYLEARSSEEEFLLTSSGQGYTYSTGVSSTDEISCSVSPRDLIEPRKRALRLRSKQGGDLRRPTNNSGDKSEFAFTLYDFHGHGRVTRDDIANLVQNIYETVGSSLSLPPSGSRTVRVKLSVAPAEVKNPEYDIIQPVCNTGSSLSPVDSPRGMEQWSVTMSPPNANLQESSRGRDSAESSWYGGAASSLSSRTREGSSYSSGRLFEVEEAESSCGSATPRKGRAANSRKVHYQRHELLQMIRASMEKNNLFYPPARSNFCHHPHHPGFHHRRRKRQHHQHCCHYSCCTCGGHQKYPSSAEPSVDPDLLKARLIHYDTTPTYHDDSTTSTDHKLLSVDTTTYCRRTLSTGRREPNLHHRSRSQDLNTDSPHVFRHHLLEPPSGQQHPLPPSNTPDRPTSPRFNQHHHSHNHHHHLAYRHRSRSCEEDESGGNSRDLLHPSDLHPHHRHSKLKSRWDPISSLAKSKTELDYHRAMSDVVNWMEKTSFKDVECGRKVRDGSSRFTSHIPINSLRGKDSDSTKVYGDSSLAVTMKKDAPEDVSLNASGCGRSQHMHQHFHHHYHHYPPTPLII